MQSGVSTTPLDPLFLVGLENFSLQLVFLVVSVAVALWGLARYRNTFSKSELGLAILIATGIFSVGVVPELYGQVAALLNVESRFLTTTLIANVVFVFLVLYLLQQINHNRRLVTDLTRQLTVEQAGRNGDHDEDTVYVVIPAYNESETVADVVRSLPATVHGHTVSAVVVSDGSRDDTHTVAKQADCTVVEHPINQGQGGALKTGFRIALDNQADIVVTMDADGQHPVGELSEITRPIVDGDADYVVGSRYLGENRSGNSATRKFGIRVFTWLINLLTNAGVTDCTNGYRAIRGSRLAELTLTEEQFNAPELIIEARKNGLRIAEVPVTVEPRRIGESKKPKLGYAVGLFRTILITWVR